MRDFGPSFFMKKIFLSPITHFNLLLVGIMIVIQSIHLHAHHTMEIDVDSYVFKFCKKNIEKCEKFVAGDY
jgi:hypothetical protein